MKKSTSADKLRESVLLLELKQANDWILLKEQFHATYESLKPINIIKNTFEEAVSAPDLKTNIVNAAIGITTGFIAKKVLIGKTYNPFTKLIGIILEIGVTKIAAKNADGIKSVGSIILNKILNNSSKKV